MFEMLCGAHTLVFSWLNCSRKATKLESFFLGGLTLNMAVGVANEASLSKVSSMLCKQQDSTAPTLAVFVCHTSCYDNST